ncbi:MAG: hypothetical protein RIR70_944 [Pseudomonadota bacterium]|jgi:prepilin-type N-terminal cleavage/methylation domain-containing protein
MKSTRGFTLLEVLVTLCVTGLLFAILMPTLSGVIAADKRLQQRQNQTDERALGAHWLTTLIQSAQPRSLGETGFMGSSREVRFTAHPQEASRPHGPLSVRLYLAETTRGQWALMADLSQPQRAMRTERVLDGLQAPRFSFLAAQASKLEDRWQDATRLPALVRFEGNIGAQPIDIAAAPRRSIGSRCRFDEVSVTCRH